MTHAMKLHPEPFSMIASGEKIYELRLWDEKRQRIAPGDQILFTCSGDDTRQITALVKALHRFPDFAALYAALPLEQCGYRPEEVAAASPADMAIYYSPEQQAKYGVVALELALIQH